MKKIPAVFMLILLATAAGAQTPGAPTPPAATPPASTPPAAEEKPAAAENPPDEATLKAKEADERDQTRRQAETERVKELQRIRDELFQKCMIKPVMTDQEIEDCRRAYKAG